MVNNLWTGTGQGMAMNRCFYSFNDKLELIFFLKEKLLPGYKSQLKMLFPRVLKAL